MSPEIFENKPYNYKSDLWALGCILYEMCTLRQAFDAKEMASLVLKVIRGNAPSIPSTFSPQLAEIVRKVHSIFR
jgi:NIMA (never in mitosis gene a)-related kinase 1/4/5